MDARKYAAKKCNQALETALRSNPSKGRLTNTPPNCIKMTAFMDPESDLFHKVAQAAYNSHMNSLEMCQMCKRKFFPERIQRHQLTCAGNLRWAGIKNWK